MARRPAAGTGCRLRWPGNFIPVGHGDDHYLILEKSINDQYMATKFRAWSPQVVQQLGVQLASPADRAAWQRAGSPTTWHVDQEYGLDTPQGPSMENLFAVKAGRDPLPFDMGATSTNKPFVIGNSVLSARQLLALPASPGPLRRLLLGGGDGGWPGRRQLLPLPDRAHGPGPARDPGRQGGAVPAAGLAARACAARARSATWLASSARPSP